MRKYFLILLVLYRTQSAAAVYNYITTYCGTGTTTWTANDYSTSALLSTNLNGPRGLDIDKFTGDTYLLDAGRFQVRKIGYSTGIVSIFAGTGETSIVSADFPNNVAATSAWLQSLRDVTLEYSGGSVSAVFFTEEVNQRIRKVSISTNILTTFAGSGAFYTDTLTTLVYAVTGYCHTYIYLLSPLSYT